MEDSEEDYEGALLPRRRKAREKILEARRRARHLKALDLRRKAIEDSNQIFRLQREVLRYEPQEENPATGDSEPHEDGSNGRREEGQRGLESTTIEGMDSAIVEKEIEDALKFSYFSTSIAGAGILGFLAGIIGNQKEQANNIHFKICAILTLATIISGGSMILVTLQTQHRRTRVSFYIIRYLKYTTLGLLSMATFDASILFLKIYALLAFVPVVVVVMVAFIKASHHDKFS